MPIRCIRSLRLVVCLFVVMFGAQIFAQVPAAVVPAKTARFSVVVQGKGPDVILLPDLGSGRDVYAAEAALLAPSHRLHLVQLAGFAGDAAGPNGSGPILAPVVEQLHLYIAENHLQRPAVIAHSLGGLLAMMLAERYPADMGRLLIVDSLPYYGLVFDPSGTVETILPQAKVMGEVLRAMPADQFALSQPLFAAKLVKSAEGRKMVIADTIQSDRDVLVNAMVEDLSTDLRPTVASIKLPMTVLYPYDASSGSEAEVTALYKVAWAGMPNVSLTRVDGALHYLMLDQPVAFHAAVVAFLQ